MNGDHRKNKASYSRNMYSFCQNDNRNAKKMNGETGRHKRISISIGKHILRTTYLVSNVYIYHVGQVDIYIRRETRRINENDTTTPHAHYFHYLTYYHYLLYNVLYTQCQLSQHIFFYWTFCGILLHSSIVFLSVCL